MAFEFNANFTYPSGKSGNFVLNCLQNQKGILNNFDEFVASQVKEGKNYLFDDIDDFLTWCWRAYILSQKTGAKTKTDFPFIHTGDLVTKTKVTLK